MWFSSWVAKASSFIANPREGDFSRWAPRKMGVDWDPQMLSLWSDFWFRSFSGGLRGCFTKVHCFFWKKTPKNINIIIKTGFQHVHFLKKMVVSAIFPAVFSGFTEHFGWSTSRPLLTLPLCHQKHRIQYQEATFQKILTKGKGENFESLLPGKLTCPLKINGWKVYFLLK